MLLRLMLLLTIVPIVELLLILKVHGFVAAAAGGNLALLTSLGTILVTGLVGASVARQQGISLLMNMQKQMQAGQMPGRALIEGVLILMGGAMLLTPGYLTDVVGFLLILPLSRPVIATLLQKKLQAAIRDGRVHVHPGGGAGAFYAAYQAQPGARSAGPGGAGAAGARPTGPRPTGPRPTPRSVRPEPEVVDAVYEDLPPQSNH